jgi:hypothetical protein
VYEPQPESPPEPADAGRFSARRGSRPRARKPPWGQRSRCGARGRDSARSGDLLATIPPRRPRGGSRVGHFPDDRPAAIPLPWLLHVYLPAEPTPPTPGCTLGHRRETAVGHTERCELLPDGIIGRHDRGHCGFGRDKLRLDTSVGRRLAQMRATICSSPNRLEPVPEESSPCPPAGLQSQLSDHVLPLSGS